MSKPRCSTSFSVLNNVKVTPDMLMVWMQLEVLRVRERTNSPNTEENHAQLAHMSRMTTKKTGKLLAKLADLGYIEVMSDSEVRVIEGARIKESTSDDNSLGKEPIPIPLPKEPTPTEPEPIPSTSKDSVDADAPTISETDQFAEDFITEVWNPMARDMGLSVVKNGVEIRKKLKARSREAPWKRDKWPDIEKRLRSMGDHWYGKSNNDYPGLKLLTLANSPMYIDKLMTGHMEAKKAVVSKYPDKPTKPELPLFQPAESWNDRQDRLAEAKRKAEEFRSGRADSASAGT